ncbi:MAG: amidohydrolase, partial [Acidobacteriaceae bacterium]|nr:amidohydrolase [Acidobacteriaceae bacterium]
MLLAAAALHAADADLILHHGRIVTVDARFTIAQAVAMKDGLIAAVGSNDTVLHDERGPKTRVIDLRGATVIPGLIDAHVHALEAGLSEFRSPLPKLDSFAAIQEYVRTKARSTPKGQWLVVPRTFPTRLKELAMPTRQVLDVATEHPVMFDASYVVVVNSLGLKISGITDAPDGILRNAQGRLKGLDSTVSFSEAEKLQALEDMLKRYAAAGLTSVGDRKNGREEIELYRKLYARHRLPVRVAMTWWLDINRPQDDLIRDIRSFDGTTNAGDHWLRLQSFKVNVDGGMTIGTAYQRQPYGPFGKQLYGQPDPDSRGQLFAPPAKLLAVMRAARDRGWQLSAHSQGGGAVDAFLDAMEALNREKPLAPSRSHLIHASFQSADAIARQKRLGVLADVQAAWLYLDGPALERVFGVDGMRMFYPLRSYLDSGVVIAGGSDHMIGHDKNRATNPYNPFLSMYVAVTRRTRSGEVIHPEQRISRADALR